jgi:transglutaminase-like putative cysteine protease
MLVESYRCQYRNALILEEALPQQPRLKTQRLSRSLWGLTATTSVCALGVGIVMFVLFPRIGSGMLGHSDPLGAGRAITGFSSTLDFRSIGTIQQSDRPVMRVRLATGDGRAIDVNEPYYFRGNVLIQYCCRRPRLGTNWEWLDVTHDQMRPRAFTERHLVGARGQTILVPGLTGVSPGEIIEQQYLIESASDPHLFTCYPAIEIESGNLPIVREWTEGQVVKTQQLPGKTLRYTVRSLSEITPDGARLLAEHRAEQQVDRPTALTPVPSLPRADEILDRIARITDGLGSIDDPKTRREFAGRIAEYLRSEEFTYTLTPPSVRRGVEPIGEFLLTTRRGHCEYFASAMAVMCQLSGIPARVVNGYRCDEYNNIGRFCVVRSKDAHAWVEVFIPGEDWVRFDPTPGERSSMGTLRRWWFQVRGVGDFLQFKWTDLVVAYDTDRRHELLAAFTDWLKRPVRDEQTVTGAVVAFVRELFGWRLKLTTRERLIYWAFTLCIVMLVLLISYVVIVLLRRLTVTLARWYRAGHHGHRRRPGVEFYQRYCRCLTRLGFNRQPHQTPLEFAEDIASTTPSLAEGVEVVRNYYDVAFGGRTLPSARSEQIEEFLHRLRHMSPADVPVPAPPSATSSTSK